MKYRGKDYEFTKKEEFISKMVEADGTFMELLCSLNNPTTMKRIDSSINNFINNYLEQALRDNQVSIDTTLQLITFSQFPNELKSTLLTYANDIRRFKKSEYFDDDAKVVLIKCFMGTLFEDIIGTLFEDIYED